MSMMSRSAFAILMAAAIGGSAAAQTPPDAAPPPPIPMSTLDPAPAGSVAAESSDEEQDPKQPKRGDFDAGGQVRLPSGPDEENKFASFNWIALDLKGRYYLLDTVTVDGLVPLAVKKPSDLMSGADPRLIGGISATLDARLPKMPKLPGLKLDTEIGLALTLGYMREGAMLLSPNDYPLFLGDFKPGIALGPIAQVKLSSLVDFSFLPQWVYQAGTDNAADGVKIPMSLILKLGDVAKLAADVGIYTGDDYSFSGDNGGRISTGAALDLKLGPILAHAGVGVATLLTGGLYPNISDSVYIDLNVRYAK